MKHINSFQNNSDTMTTVELKSFMSDFDIKNDLLRRDIQLAVGM